MLIITIIALTIAAIGLPSEVFENQEEEIEKQREIIAYYKSRYASVQKEMYQFKTMNL